MNKLNSYGHDESQYLPHGTPPVNPFRAQHGRLEWVEKTLHAKSWLPDILYLMRDEHGNEVLTQDNLNTCLSFYRSVVATRNALGITNLRAYLAQGHANATPKDIFHAVITQLLPYQSNLCLWIVCDDYNHGNINLALKLATSIQQSLENAQKIIDDLYE